MSEERYTYEGGYYKGSTLMHVDKDVEGDFHIKKGTETIDNSAFREAENVTRIFIPDSVSLAGFRCSFHNCKKLKTFEVDANNQDICVKDDILYDKNMTTILAVPCTKGGDLHIPEGITEVAHLALDNCDLIETMYIPSTLESNHRDFCKSHALKSIEVSEKNPEYASVNGILYSKDLTDLLYVPLNYTEKLEILDSVERAKLQKNISASEIILPEALASVPSDAGITPGRDWLNVKYNTFSGGCYLGTKTNPFFAFIHPEDTSVEVCELHPDTQILWSGAFFYCPEIRKITIPDSVKIVGECLFDDMPHTVIIQCSYQNSKNFSIQSFYLFSDLAHDVALYVHYQDGSSAGLVHVFKAGYNYDAKEQISNLSSSRNKYNHKKYDETLCANAGKLKMDSKKKLLAMMMRLYRPIDLTDVYRTKYVAALTKDITKAIAVADFYHAPELINAMASSGVITEDNKKKVISSLKKATSPEVAELAALD